MTVPIRWYWIVLQSGAWLLLGLLAACRGDTTTALIAGLAVIGGGLALVSEVLLAMEDRRVREDEVEDARA